MIRLQNPTCRCSSSISSAKSTADEIMLADSASARIILRDGAINHQSVQLQNQPQWS
uniref:Uncharacterized protein n=1 Tax=Anopheles funestus TaxID=62324 RepID=A0A182R258_ANOFN